MRGGIIIGGQQGLAPDTKVKEVSPTHHHIPHTPNNIISVLTYTMLEALLLANHKTLSDIQNYYKNDIDM